MDGIVRVRTIAFTPDRMPTLRRIKLGFEGDNLVERLEFDLPDIAQGQTATLMITGADAVKLDRTDEGRYAVDLTKDMIGPDGEREAYIRIDGTGEKVWKSAPMRMVTGALPDVEEEIEKVYPTAVGQMLTAMAEHSGEMQAQEERVEQAAQRAEEAAERAEAGGGGGGTSGKDGGYYQPSVTDGVLTWTPSNANMPSVPASDVRGPAGQDGQQGKDGTPGKTAYQYAQDGGYTGTEEEFAAKLAEEVYSKVETDVAIEEATLNNAVPEIIREMTINEEGIRKITIDTDNDGKPFMLKSAYLEMNVPKAAANSNLWTTWTGDNDIAVASTATPGLSDTSAKVIFGRIEKTNGVWNAVIGGTSSETNSPALYGNYKKNNDNYAATYVKQWGMTVLADLPIGTKIVIKGVRA